MRRVAVRSVAAATILATVLLGSAAPAAADEVRANSVETRATVNADGSMDVVETLDLDFDGEFNGGFRNFDPGPYEIVGFTVSEDGEPRDLAPGFDDPNTGGPVRWFGSDDHEKISGRHVYTLSYTVIDAVQVFSDVAVLEWQFVGREAPSIPQVRVDINFPGDGTDLRAFGHGALQGVVLPVGNQVVLRVLDNPAGQFVEALVTLPPSNFTVTPQPVPALDRILAEEAALADAANAERAQAREFFEDSLTQVVDDGLPSGCTEESSATLERRCERLAALLAEAEPRVGRELGIDDANLLFDILDARASVDEEVDRVVDERNATIGNIVAPVVAVAAAGAWFLVWLTWGKEPPRPSDIGDYWREVPEESPAVVAAIDDWGVIDSKAFAATVIDLAQRGWLTITEEGDTHRFTRTQQTEDELPLLDYESAALWKLFEGGRPTVTQDELVAEATGDRTGSASWMAGFKAQVKADYDTNQFQSKHGCLPWLLHIVLVLIVGGTAALAFLLQAWVGGGIAAATALVMLVLGVLLRRRTEAGARKHAEISGLKAFLRDFSLVDDVPVGHLALYERYLVYAVALGVADRLIQGMRMRFPELADPNRGFAPWYVYGAAGHHGDGGFDRFTSLGTVGSFANDFSSATASAFSPPSSSSGGGGGFSGGGGGGGGGGGFGGW